MIKMEKIANVKLTRIYVLKFYNDHISTVEGR